MKFMTVSRYAPPQSEREEIDEENHSLVEDDRIFIKIFEKIITEIL